MLFTYRLLARQHFTADAIMDNRNALAAEQGYRLTFLCNSIGNSNLCSTSSLLRAFGDLNQISFLYLNVGIFIDSSLFILIVTRQPSMLLVLIVNSEFSCPNTKANMSQSKMEKSCPSIYKRHHPNKCSYGNTPERHSRAKPRHHLRNT